MKSLTMTAAAFMGLHLLPITPAFGGDFVIGRAATWKRVVVAPLSEETPSEDLRTLKQSLLQDPAVLAVTAFSEIPSRTQRETIIYFEQEGTENAPRAYYLNVDHQFLNVLDIDLLEGRFFLPDLPSDLAMVVLNESAARLLAETRAGPGRYSLIGQQITLDKDSREVSHSIIGIIEDFRFRSAPETLAVPVLLALSPSDLKYVGVRTTDVEATCAALEDVYRHRESQQRAELEPSLLSELVKEHDVRSATTPRASGTTRAGGGSMIIYFMHFILAVFVAAAIALIIANTRWPLMWSLWGFDGRVSRRKFFVVWLVLFAINVAFIQLIEGTSYPWFYYVPGGIAYVLATLLQAFNIVKRLHDLGRSGTHYWLLFVPFYNIYLMVVLFFKRGSAGEYDRGSDLGLGG